MSDIEAADLARELNMSVSTLLAWADETIEKTFRRDGHEAIEGMTTRSKRHGKHTTVVVSGKLADVLRTQRYR